MVTLPVTSYAFQKMILLPIFHPRPLISPFGDQCWHPCQSKKFEATNKICFACHPSIFRSNQIISGPYWAKSQAKRIKQYLETRRCFGLEFTVTARTQKSLKCHLRKAWQAIRSSYEPALARSIAAQHMIETPQLNAGTLKGENCCLKIHSRCSQHRMHTLHPRHLPNAPRMPTNSFDLKQLAVAVLFKIRIVLKKSWCQVQL